MTTRRDILKASAALLLPSAVFADKIKFQPLQATTSSETKPERTLNEKSPNRFTVSDFVLHMQSASYCGPCQSWKRSEKQKVIVPVEYSNLGFSRVPAFQLRIQWPLGAKKFVRINRGKSTANQVDQSQYIQWRGYTAASQVNNEIKRQLRIRNMPESKPVKGKAGKVRRTLSELRSWVRKNYTQNTSTRHADVNPRSYVWQHLQGVKHGFAANQVRGLSQWEALALHSGRHQGTITPWR